MKIKLLLILFAIALSSCTTGIVVNNKNVLEGKLPSDAHPKAKFGTLSKEVREQLGLFNDRGVVAVISDGNVIFYGVNGKGFKYSGEKPTGKLVEEVTFKIYKASPECELIDDGSGFKFWYPWDCPHKK